MFYFFMARRGVEWLFGTIILNLVLVGVFGTKLISVFGLVTNVGNVFYACVFFATYFLLERHNKRIGFKTIWFGVVFVLFFIMASQLTVRFEGLPLSETINNATTIIFAFSPRIVFGSLIAYVFGQYINILIYEQIKVWTHGKFLWLRVNGANIASQLVDSLLFFSIVFFDLPGPILLQTILVGWLIKTVVVALGTPLLYFDSKISQKTNEP